MMGYDNAGYPTVLYGTCGVDCLFNFYFSIEKKIRVVEKCINYSRNVDRAVGFSGINR